MRFNAAGDGATGVAGGTIGINGATPAALAGVVGGGGSNHGPSWLSATKIVYQSGGVGGVGPWVLESYDTGTLARATVDANPNNECAAGNAIWGTFLASSPSVLKSNNGIGTVSGAGLGDVSQDFGELVKLNAYPAAQGVTAYNAAGSVLYTNPTAMVTSGIVRVRGHILSYQVANAWLLQPLIGSLTWAARIQEPINWVTPLVLASGTALVLERSNRLTLRYARSGQGWIVMDAEVQFNPDVVEVSAGVVRIGWCINQGETPTSLHLAELTVATGAIRYATSFTAGVPNWGTFAPANAQTFPVGPAGTTSNGVSAAGLIPPYQSPVTDQGGLISKPWYKWTENVKASVTGAAATVSAIPPSGQTPVTGAGVTASSGPLTTNQLTIGDAVSDIQSLGSFGTTTTVLHGNASGAPTFGSVADADLIAGRVLVRRATVTLTDAQIKALPTTPITVVAGPGGGFRLVLIQCDLETKFAAAYTNIDATTPYLVLALDTNEIGNYVGKDGSTTPVLTALTDLLVTNARSSVQMVPFTQDLDPASAQWGNTAEVRGLNFDGMALKITMNNQGTGNLTGGNAANVMALHVYYLVEAVIA